MVQPTDNTEGSLTEVQKEILVGVLLGDGTMRKKTHALLEINHSIKQKALVDWLYKIFHQYVLTPPKSRVGRGSRIAYRFTTRSLPIFTQYYDRFYQGNKKIIPSDIQLTPMTLAVWYMDDGSRCEKDIYLNTQQFNKQEQIFLSLILKEQFEIFTTLNRDKKYFRLRVLNQSVPKFMSIIQQHILHEFKYKLLL